MESKNKSQKTQIPAHRILREVLRHYTEYQEFVKNNMNDHVIDHSYYVQNENGTQKKITISISFWDLQDSLRELAPRKREAVYWNVIRDQKQKDVAKRMGITTVSVGQYVENAVEQIAAKYFSEQELG
jgi:DNA-directed RNA polymerase specialized sigma24 family protein